MPLTQTFAPLLLLLILFAALSFGPSIGSSFGSAVPQRPFGSHAYAYASGSIRPSNVTQTQLDSATKAFYDAWKKRYLVHDCGSDRYNVRPNRAGKRRDGGSISLSEGHGYGMIITALMAGYDPNAQTYFDGLYRFFKDHPSVHSPYLMAWRQVRGCGNAPHGGSDSATDGDLDVAYALILASRQWGSSGPINYLQEATNVISAIQRREINNETSLTQLGDFVTPSMPEFYYGTRSSDFMPDHFRVFRALTGNMGWARAIDSGYLYFETLQAKFSPTPGLVPDFIQDTNTSPRPADPDYLETAHDGHYFYNACRVPWRLATDYLVSGDRRARKTVEKMTAWIRRETGGNPSLIHAGYDLSGTSVSDDHSLAFVAPFAVGAMVNPTNQQWLNALWNFMVNMRPEDSDYYGNTIKLLSMIIISGNWWAP